MNSTFSPRALHLARAPSTLVAPFLVALFVTLAGCGAKKEASPPDDRDYEMAEPERSSPAPPADPAPEPETAAEADPDGSEGESAAPAEAAAEAAAEAEAGAEHETGAEPEAGAESEVDGVYEEAPGEEVRAPASSASGPSGEALTPEERAAQRQEEERAQAESASRPPFQPSPRPATEAPPPDETTPTAPAEPQPVADAYWNSWQEKNCLPVLNWFGCDYVDALERGKRYKFRLTVSAQALAPRDAVRTAEALQTTIERARADAPDETLILNVVPVLTEGGIRLPPGAPRTYEISINPAKFRVHDVVRPETIEEQIKLANELSAGDVTIAFDVTDTASACSHIMLSIWDAQLRKPLDSLIVPVAVKTEAAAVDGCGSGLAREQMRGGADSLIAYGTAAGDANPPEATVGLHTFDFDIGGAMRSFAVFAARDAGREHVYGWEMESVLSGRIGRAAALPQRVREARDILYNEASTEEQRKAAYAIAADLLQTSIFSAKGGSGQSEADAKAALELFKTVVDKNPEPLTVYARFTMAGDGGTSLYYAPLGLLSASGGNVLAKKLRVVQPLPLQHARERPCIDSWTIAGSTELLSNIHDPAAKAALEWMLKADDKPAWVREKILDAERLKSFLGEGPAYDGKPEGVLLLAHHSTDRGLWFGTSDPPILVEHLKRRYAPGSAMVLGACSTAGPAAADDALKRLNLFGVDGLIVSPFPVDAAYTIRLAQQVVIALDEGYARGTEATMADIFDTALERTAASFVAEDERDKYMEQVGMEYVLAGDPDIRLCKRQPTE